MTQVSSIYLHIPFCMHLCNYCDFFKRKLEDRSKQFEDFHQFLRSSQARHADFLQGQGFELGELETIYLGGGTPSLWGADGATFFGNELQLKPARDCEFTMEIDPGTWTDEMLGAWKEQGLNRISIGTQTLNQDFLRIMDRVHSLEDSVRFLEKLHKEKWNYSLDFLLGIPYSQERARDIKAELDLLLEYGPKHISLYILNARSKYPHIQQLPDDDYIREEYLFVSDYLKSKGFHHYEVSNFALPGFESRHNLKYWKSENVAALGPTGTGFLRTGKTEAFRYKWKVSQAEFEIEKLGASELQLEETYLRLRTSLGLQKDKDLLGLYQAWKQQGFAHEEGEFIKLTSLGFLMLDSLMDDLFRWEAHGGKPNSL